MMFSRIRLCTIVRSDPGLERHICIYKMTFNKDKHNSLHYVKPPKRIVQGKRNMSK